MRQLRKAPNGSPILRRVAAFFGFPLLLGCFLAGPVAPTSNGAQDEVLSFRTSILPLLTKAGCNAGACHGAATGQGGFKLSLLGYDPEEDYDRITRELGGRRLDFGSPAESLLLRKPTRQVPHEGGRRLVRESQNYRKLLRWIRDGAPVGDKDLSVTAIQVTPSDILLAATNQTISLRVMASLSNGSTEDVTELALYTSNDDAIAEVGKTGEIITRGRGLTSIMVRYSGQVAAARVAVPYHETARVPDFPIRNFVDAHVRAELERLRLAASPRSSDAEFLRRVYLDLIGRLPSSDEARAFLRGPGSRDRQRVIADLLKREEFVDYWTMHLGDLLLVGGKGSHDEGARAYYHWLREQVQRNVGFDRVAISLLTASGDFVASPPANFFNLASDPRDLAEHVGRIFLGTQIGCARCHAHPSDRWTQEDYHQFAAFFARVTRDGGQIKAAKHGEVDHPKTARPMAPRPLGGPAPEIAPGADRRPMLTAWLTAPDNPRFARAVVNRVWKHFLGRGLVEPVDDLRPTNPATHPALLDALAESFVASGFDLRSLIQTVVSSHTYQLSSQSSGGNDLDDRLYSHFFAKPLPAAVFVDAVAQVTGVLDRYEGHPEGTRAIQLVSSRTPSYALDVLGRCARDRACATSNATGGGLAQALHLLNGSTINDKVRDGCVREWLARGWSNQQIVEEIYLRAFTREPEPNELAGWEELLAGAPDRTEAIEDLLWTVLNSREFSLNH